MAHAAGLADHQIGGLQVGLQPGSTFLLAAIVVQEARAPDLDLLAIDRHARRAPADAEHGLLHVPAWGRTWEGEQFADAMGGDTMDDEQAAEILGLDLAEMMAYGQE